MKPIMKRSLIPSSSGIDVTEREEEFEINDVDIGRNQVRPKKYPEFSHCFSYCIGVMVVERDSDAKSSAAGVLKGNYEIKTTDRFRLRFVSGSRDLSRRTGGLPFETVMAGECR